ncbi:MAG: hypothetical protein IJF20_04665 [Clostridia bacterium]|nr:hypothetical protein [Clostridia bacterium]
MLVYSLNDSGDAYTVTDLLDFTTEKVVIPDEHEGLPVTEVTAFFGAAENLKEIIFGNNVRITDYDVLNFPSLERVFFGRSIETVSGPFENAENLAHIYYSGTEEEWQNVRIYFTDAAVENYEKAEKHFGILGKASFLTFEDETIFPYTHWHCVKGKPKTTDARKISFDNSTSGLKAENVKEAIDELNSKHFDVTAIDSWETLLYLVRSGRAGDFVHVGDQFVSTKDGSEIVWDVIGIDQDIPADEDKKHSLTLQMRDCYVNMPFSVPEGSYFTVSELTAGEYYIEMTNYDSPSKFYSFTLNENLPRGGIIRICDNMVYLYSSRRSVSHASFAVDSVSDSEEGLTGEKLGSGNIMLHSEMGNMDYSQSDIRKWLNSSEKDWWSMSNDYSLAPLDYMSVSGFCTGMDEDFLAAVNPVKKRTVLSDGSEIITEDKFFLISSEEVFAEGENAYEYYRENSSYTSPDKSSDGCRIKNLEHSPCHWWLRNSAYGDDGLMRVLTDGAVGSVKVKKVLAYGISPACCIC